MHRSIIALREAAQDKSTKGSWLNRISKAVESVRHHLLGGLPTLEKLNKMTPALRSLIDEMHKNGWQLESLWIDKALEWRGQTVPESHHAILKKDNIDLSADVGTGASEAGVALIDRVKAKMIDIEVEMQVSMVPAWVERILASYE